MRHGGGCRSVGGCKRSDDGGEVCEILLFFIFAIKIMHIDNMNSHFGRSNGPRPSIIQSSICGGEGGAASASVATNEASAELKMLAHASAVKMDGACPIDGSASRSPCTGRWLGVLVVGWRRGKIEYWVVTE